MVCQLRVRAAQQRWWRKMKTESKLLSLTVFTAVKISFQTKKALPLRRNSSKTCVHELVTSFSTHVWFIVVVVVALSMCVYLPWKSSLEFVFQHCCFICFRIGSVPNCKPKYDSEFYAGLEALVPCGTHRINVQCENNFKDHPILEKRHRAKHVQSSLTDPINSNYSTWAMFMKR